MNSCVNQPLMVETKQGWLLLVVYLGILSPLLPLVHKLLHESIFFAANKTRMATIGCAPVCPCYAGKNRLLLVETKQEWLPLVVYLCVLAALIPVVHKRLYGLPRTVSLC